MPVFEIQGPDGKTYELDAPDESAALKAFGQIGAAPKPETSPVDGVKQMAKAGALGAMDGASFGFADELGAGLGAASEGIAGLITGTPGRSYSQIKDAMRAQDRQAQEEAPGSYLGGQVLGAIGTGGGMAAGGLSMGVNAARAGQGLGRVAMASAGDGAIMGGASGVGSGEDLPGRALGGATGFFGGLAMGAAAPVAVAGLSGAVKPLVAPIMSRMRPDTYANAAMGEGLRRSGSSVDDIAAMLTAAQRDGQGQFNVADAMGLSGQRMLSTVARTPNDARQMVFEALENRQMGQGERLSNFLAEGFDAPDTAAQRVASLTDARTSEANQLYGAARRNAGTVNVTGIIKAIDDTILPGAQRVARPGDNIAYDTIEGALSKVKSQITDGRSNVVDFETLFRTKLDVDDAIKRAEGQGAGNRAHYLARVQNEIDDALAKSSPQYAAARDAFATASRRIEAVGQGKAAASGRTRAPDNIEVFQAMTPEEQAAYRAGYVDPLITRVESASVSPTTNKARPLMSEKTGQEIPAFAEPSQVERLGKRLNREARMFQTAQAALGGSKTADNLADAADLAKFDPTVIKTLVREGPVAAAMAAVGRALGEAKGLPPTVVERIARNLMETDPQAARQILTRGVTKSTRDDVVKGLAGLLATSIGSSGAGRLAKP